MLKTKNGTLYKNKSCIAGALGELYVSKYLKCPKCNYRLIKLTDSMPSLDFKCGNPEENHWFQVKTYQDTRCPISGVWSLHCGEYTKQEEVFFGGSYDADVLVIRYSGKTKSVKSIHWFKNESIHPTYLTPYCHKQKRFSRKGGVKKKVGTITYIKSILKVNSNLSEEIPIKYLQLPGKIGENQLPKSPLWRYKVENNLVCLNTETCSCNLEKPSNCCHISEGWKLFQDSSFQHLRVKGRDRYYAVDLDTMTCTCPSFTYRKTSKKCKHLDEVSVDKKRRLGGEENSSQPKQKRQCLNFTIEL